MSSINVVTALVSIGLAVSAKFASSYHDFLSSPKSDEVGFLETLDITNTTSIDAVAHVVLGLVSYFVLSFARSYYKFRFSPLRDAPGFGPRSFVYGMFYEFLEAPFMEPPILALKKLREGGKEIPFLAYTTLFGSQRLLLLDCDLIKHVFTAPSGKDPMRYPKHYVYLREVVGDGLVVVEGQEWSRHRRIIQPAFQSMFLKDAIGMVVPALVENLVNVWKKTAGTTINMNAHLSLITLDVIGKVAFSHEFNASKLLNQWAESPDKELGEVDDPLISSIGGSFSSSPLKLMLTVLKLPWLEKHLSPSFRTTRNLLNKAADDIVQNARNIKDPSRRSVLNLMMEAKDGESSKARNQLTDTELRDEVKTFLVAGHETTSTWSHWALYVLAIRPDLQEKVYADVMKHAPPNDETIVLEQADQMEYMWAFMNETLRLYSPLGLISRVTHQEENFKGYTIPKGTNLRIPIHLIHRHPDHWKDPEVFRPERWFDKEETSKRHKFAFIPFAAGGRNCIGQRFATMEAKIIVANVAKNFKIHLADSMKGKEITFSNFISLKCNPEVEIRVEARK
mmetsp:Transcript_5154/g.11944  ORF Transcript_5154/g.11944 Transcript_5154/m.11944 type:complete len:565 (-) Transcript_5154:212-1906(-)